MAGITYQAVTFFYALYLGAVLCLVYDIIMLSRIIFGTTLLVINIEDMIFAFIAAFLCFGVTLAGGENRMRFFIAAGIILGAVLFENIIGKYIKEKLENICRAINKRGRKVCGDFIKMLKSKIKR